MGSIWDPLETLWTQFFDGFFNIFLKILKYTFGKRKEKEGTEEQRGKGKEKQSKGKKLEITAKITAVISAMNLS